jgi:drug/metabolite transporter (DMT)-like permease
MVNLQMNLRDWAMLIALAAIWSVSYLFNRVGLTELPVLSVVAGRVGFAALALVPMVYASGLRLPRIAARGQSGGGRAWLVFLMMAMLNNVAPFTLIVAGQQWVDSGLTAILIGTTPLFGVVLAHFLTSEERMTPARVLGVIVGVAGLVVLVGPAALAGLGDALLGQALIVAAALSYALAAIAGRRWLKGIPPLVSSTGQILCASAILVPAAAIVDAPWRFAPSLPVWGAVLGSALLCTVLAYLLYFRLLASAGATNLLLVTLLVPVGAVIAGALVVDEPLTLPMLAGMALIAAGLAIIDGRVLRLRVRAGTGAG